MRLPEHPWWPILLFAVCVLWVSCGPDKPAETPGGQGAPAAEEGEGDDEGLPPLNIPSEVPEKPRGLQVSELPPVGKYLLPERVHEGLKEPGISRYELEASLEDIMEFYSKRGYRVVRHPKGATVYPRKGEGLLQIVKSGGRKWKLMFITSMKSD